MNRLHVFQHLETESAGHATIWAQKRNIDVSISRFYSDDYILPSLDEIDGLVVLGGPMNVTEEDQYPHLTEEKEFIRKAFRNGKKVFGICLGAQLIASALGADVYKNHMKEIGWYPIHVTEAGKKSKYFEGFPHLFTSFHFHEYTFDLPEGAELLASTPECPNQAYSIDDRIFAVQFHPEMQESTVVKLTKSFLQEMGEGEKIQCATDMLEYCKLIPDNLKRLETLLDIFFLQD